jgi:hypothetical protein
VPPVPILCHINQIHSLNHFILSSHLLPDLLRGFFLPRSLLHLHATWPIYILSSLVLLSSYHFSFYECSVC